MADQNSITNPPENPEGICQCGCGQNTVKAQKHPGFNKFVHGHNSRGSGNPMWGRGQKQAQNPNWKGGKCMNGQGYVLIHQPNHPQCDKKGYVREHILVIEKAFRRPLRPEECVHHIDEDKSNNTIGNLMVFATVAMHNAFHARLRAFKATGHWDWLKCYICKQYDHPNNIVKYRPNSYRHAQCILNYNSDLLIKKSQQVLDEEPPQT